MHPISHTHHSPPFRNPIPSAPRPHLLGLKGLLNPPTRFIYCLYSVFFSFLTPNALFPGTFVFFVVLNVAKPIIFRIRAISGSESTSMAVVELGLVVGDLVPLVPLVAGGGLSAMEVWGLRSKFDRAGFRGSAGGWGFGGGGFVVGFRGWVLAGVAFDNGSPGGERVRVEGLSLRGGERERVRWRVSSLTYQYILAHSSRSPFCSPRRDLCLSLLVVRSLSLLSLSPPLSPFLYLPPPLSRDRLLSRLFSVLSLDLDLRLPSSRRWSRSLLSLLSRPFLVSLAELYLRSVSVALEAFRSHITELSVRFARFAGGSAIG